MHEFIAWLDAHPLFWPAFIYCARITDVSIGTMRTIFVVRGYRLTAAVLGFFEVLIWITAVSGVLSHLDRWENLLAYGAGFASGNVLGIWIEQTLAIGRQAVRLISPGRSAAVAEGLRLAGYAVTELKGHGRDGEVSVSLVVVPRKETPTVIRVAQQIDPNVFTTVEDVRAPNVMVYRAGVPPGGWRAIMKRK